MHADPLRTHVVQSFRKRDAARKSAWEEQGGICLPPRPHGHILTPKPNFSFAVMSPKSGSKSPQARTPVRARRRSARLARCVVDTTEIHTSTHTNTQAHKHRHPSPPPPHTHTHTNNHPPSPLRGAANDSPIFRRSAGQHSDKIPRYAL